MCQSICSGHQFSLIAYWYHIQDFWSERSSPHFPFLLIHFGNLIYQFLLNHIYFFLSRKAILLLNASSGWSVKRSGHCAKTNHSLIWKFQYVYYLKFLFMNQVQYTSQHFISFCQSKIPLRHQFLILTMKSYWYWLQLDPYSPLPFFSFHQLFYWNSILSWAISLKAIYILFLWL